MNHQLALTLPHQNHMSREHFVVSPANEAAVIWLEHWQGDPYATVIYGESSCGKTHLAHIWAQQHHAHWLEPLALEKVQVQPSGWYILDGLEQVWDEVALFHLLNQVKEQGAKLLMTSAYAPELLTFNLPDVCSRLRAVHAVKVEKPDDNLLGSVIQKYFSDRQLNVSSEVVDYMLLRIDRSFQAARELVELLDRLALRHKRNITVPFVRDVLEGQVK